MAYTSMSEAEQKRVNELHDSCSIRNWQVHAAAANAAYDVAALILLNARQQQRGMRRHKTTTSSCPSRRSAAESACAWAAGRTSQVCDTDVLHTYSCTHVAPKQRFHGQVNGAAAVSATQVLRCSHVAHSVAHAWTSEGAPENLMQLK
eukprot:TRINITY_DN9393_c0_g1_i1.p2 TRINITY_DN9393_c0_g1~~TRINITY_DN9393_c0_g1_i1.p2  ORF type:complete len:148 (-),score=16.07 TRINITY_DN9393_c0_g1_i1:516-959(-)